MAKALAVIALLSLGGARVGATVRLVTWLLAVIAKPLGRRAHLGVMAYIAALITGSARQ